MVSRVDPTVDVEIVLAGVFGRVGDPKGVIQAVTQDQAEEVLIIPVTG